MSERMITIPVKATMRQQPDGHFEMTDAEYVTCDADVVAAFIAKRFGLTMKEENECGGERHGRR